ncbi:MAG: SDR family oxidoreductase [Rhodoferax sp.]|nr:SDR family oxidoreductase [Rhodoferax sp.]
MHAHLGKTVMVTGAAGHLGQAVARHFSSLGAGLVLVDRNRQALEAVCPAHASVMLADINLLHQDEVSQCVEQAVGRFGRIDVLCNLAGGFRMGEAVHETSDANWNFLHDINARTLLHMARAVVPVMLKQGGGKIVNVAAYAGLRGVAQMGAYTASKSTVMRMTEAMSAELKEQGINVNCVLPSILDTPENRAAMPKADPARWVAPQALAEVIAFLASDAARAIHGAALPVTGLS